MAEILVFAPHPDDDVIGCGGSIRKHIENGNNVSIVYLSSGEAGSLNYSKAELALIRENEARSAARIQGVSRLIFMRIPDGYIRCTENNLIALVNILREIMPSCVYLPHASESVLDHREAHHLIMEACGRSAGPWFQECSGDPWNVARILAYEVWTPLSRISYVEDISLYMDNKLEALRAHQSQLTDISYDQAIEGFNRYRGIMTGSCLYAECFEVIKAGDLR